MSERLERLLQEHLGRAENDRERLYELLNNLGSALDEARRALDRLSLRELEEEDEDVVE